MKIIIITDDRKLLFEGLKELLVKTAFFDKVICIDTNTIEKFLKTDNKSFKNAIVITNKNISVKKLYEIKMIAPSVKIISVYENEDINFYPPFINGWISLEWSYEELKNAIKHFINEGIVVPKKMAAKIIKKECVKNYNMINSFTQKEKLIIRHLCEGMINKEIAKSLGLKEKTVKNYLNKIYSKLGVKRKTEAILKLFLLGMM